MDGLARARAQADEIAGRHSGDPEVAELARCVVTLCEVIAAIQGRTGVELVRAERENKREDEGADRDAHELLRRDAELRAAEGRAGREG